MNKYIRTSKHSLKYTNTGKYSVLNMFIDEYEKAVNNYIEYIWNNKITWVCDGKEYYFSIKDGLFNAPKFISTTDIKFETRLSARALKCASTQALGIVKSVTNKYKKLQNKVTWMKSKGHSISSKMFTELNSLLTCPITKNITAELNSIVVNVSVSNNTFNKWVILSSLFNDVRGLKINIPIKMHSRAIKWENAGKLLSGVNISRKEISLRYEVECYERKEGRIEGVDQGIVTCVTLSDGQVSRINNHGYDLSKIIDVLSRKKKGSKAFAKAQEHRKNYINWSLNQLNLKGIKELYLERIVNINYKRNVSRKLKHFTNTIVRDSLQKLCVEKGVLFKLVDNEYNSQRCFNCGWVKKSNRNGKVFCCSKCDAKSDADFNASQNIKQRLHLPKLGFKFMDVRHNLQGFFWNPDGCFSSDGEELDSLNGSIYSPSLPLNKLLPTFSC